MKKLASAKKKPVESQYSSLSHKKTNTFTLIASNFVREQLIIYSCIKLTCGDAENEQYITAKQTAALKIVKCG